MGNKTGRDEYGRVGSNGRKPWCEEIARAGIELPPVMGDESLHEQRPLLALQGSPAKTLTTFTGELVALFPSVTSTCQGN